MKTALHTSLVLLFALTCAASEPNESLRNMTNAEAVVEAKLKEFSQTDDYRVLLEARKTASSLNPRDSSKTLGVLDTRCLRLQLETMMAIQNVRDLSYDPNAPENAVYINVSPPMQPANDQPLASGMDPEAIRDPVAREKYKEAIEQNRRRNEKAKRELYLSRAVDRAVIAVHCFVRSLTSDSESRKQATQMIEEIVTDKTILERLKSKEHPGLTR